MTKVRHYKNVGYGQSPQFQQNKSAIFGPPNLTFLGPWFPGPGHFCLKGLEGGSFFALRRWRVGRFAPDLGARAFFALRRWRGGRFWVWLGSEGIFCLKALEGGSRPDLTWPDLTDLTWPDLTWPDPPWWSRSLLVYIFIYPAQNRGFFSGEIMDSVRNQHFLNAGLSSCPHTTTFYYNLPESFLWTLRYSTIYSSCVVCCCWCLICLFLFMHCLLSLISFK